MSIAVLTQPFHYAFATTVVTYTVFVAFSASCNPTFAILIAAQLSVTYLTFDSTLIATVTVTVRTFYRMLTAK